MHYISVENVDEATERAKAAGAKVNMGPLDIPNVGRAAYIQDPQGAMVALFRDAKGDAPLASPPFANGAFCWETLNTTDKAGSVAFYTKVVPMHSGDFYGNATLATGDQPQDAICDVSDAPPGVPSHWMSHVVVANLAESRERAASLGATILMAEIDIPNVGKMCVIADPVGATLSLYEAAPR